MDSAWRGSKAMEQKDFAKAIAEYTTALTDNPKGITFYLQRSECLLRLKPADPTSSLQDAERALVLATERGRRELMGKAQLRRGHAFYIMENYADAQVCFGWAKKLIPKDNSIGIWESKTANSLKGLTEGDEKGTVKALEKPNLSVEDATKDATKDAVSSKPDGSAETQASSTKSNATEDAAVAAKTALSEPQKQVETPAAVGVQTPPSRIRHDWYQSADAVTITLMVKGVPKDKATVDIQPGSIAISFPLPTGSDYDFSLDPLFAEIDPSKSAYKILSTKIELSLRKVEFGRKWHNLEGSEPVSTDAPASTNKDGSIRQAVLRPAAPAYPTSSKSGPKNWDKVASELTKKSNSKAEDSKDKGEAGNKAKEEDEKEEVEDAYVSDEEADPVNGFFKKLYKNADPDTRRAMMKSYTESNGTALSTNWSEVGRAPVETSPPDGMVAKKWEG